tara:strand:+ start:378 stop:749 length:372 start_codon:yes stop_codon:yes gene_type:complete
MKTPKELKSIFDKFPKEKTELKAERVQLTIMNDIDEALGRGFGMEEFVQDAIDIAQKNMTKARDILGFDMNDALAEAEGYIEEAEQALKELGADSAKLDGYKQELNRLQKTMDALDMEIKRVG